MYLNVCFSSLLGIPTEIKSSAIGLEICRIAGGTKKNKSIIKQKRRSMIKEYC